MKRLPLLPDEVRKLKEKVELYADRLVMAAVRSTTAKLSLDDALAEENRLKHELQKAIDDLAHRMAEPEDDA